MAAQAGSTAERTALTTDARGECSPWDDANDPTSDPRRLADAARSCIAMRAADMVADWIGAGRSVRTIPVLGPVQRATMARALSTVEPSPRADDGLGPVIEDEGMSAVVPAWSRAQHAGLIETRGTRTVRGPASEAWRSGDPELVLQLWREAYDSYTGLESEVRDEPYVRPEAFGAQATLRLLEGEDGPRELVWIRRSVARTLHSAQRGLQGKVLDPDRDAAAGLRLLAEFGAVEHDENSAWLTPLGRWLIRSRRGPSGWARSLVRHLCHRGVDADPGLVCRWIERSNPATAVRELLTVGAEAGVAERSVAVELARKAGAAAETEWRRWVTHPTIGPHARIWVATVADGRSPDEQDADWALLDRLGGMVRRDDRAVVRDAVRWHCHELFGLDAVRRVGAMGHPDAERIVAVLTAHHAFQRHYLLRVELRGVTEPTVWRRISVPAGCTLSQLNRALVTALGWGGGREYAFEIAGARYASNDRERSGRSDSSAEPGESVSGRLDDLVRAGDSFVYEYDELDRWTHDLHVESDEQEAPAAQWARVVDGSGACPPADCGGVVGYRRIREALFDLSDPDCGRAHEMLGVETPEDFDPAAFDPMLPNAVLAAETARAIVPT